MQIAYKVSLITVPIALAHQSMTTYPKVLNQHLAKFRLG